MIHFSNLKLYYSETDSLGKEVVKGSNVLKLSPASADEDVVVLAGLIGDVQTRTVSSMARVDEKQLV